MKLSIILPAKNEETSLRELLPELLAAYPEAEIILVDDGSTDGTVALCTELGVQVISHSRTMGNGAAVKAGARAATGDVLVFMDADSQHRPDQIAALLESIDRGADMVVGARSWEGQANWLRGTANALYNRIAGYMTGTTIPDLTSGFRAVVADKFKPFLFLLPNGFSYPTTITMAFLRMGYVVEFCPILMRERRGSGSHIRPLRDGVRFLVVIFRIGSLYSPLKLFAPIGLAFFLLGLSYYFYTYATVQRFTNMSALLLANSVLVFLIGLVSEQLTTLLYAAMHREPARSHPESRIE